MTDKARHRLWAELADDSELGSLRLVTLGWVPRKRERVVGPTPRHACCLLARGRGSFRVHGEDRPRTVVAPGLFFTSPEMAHDYGPESARDAWEEFYWIVEGPRVEEWRRSGWWPTQATFHTLTKREAASWESLFRAGLRALEQRSRREIDGHKLAFERQLHRSAARADTGREIPGSALHGVLEAWRRDPCRAWSLHDSARQTGMSYTRFRLRFREEFRESPHAWLVRLRIELATRWLRGTDEPVKAIAARCGFARVETFIRAFVRVHGVAPARWRSGVRR